MASPLAAKSHAGAPAKQWLASTNFSVDARLARCQCLSETGLLLVMERLNDLSLDDFAAMPDVPVWLGDTKPATFGKRG